MVRRPPVRALAAMLLGLVVALPVLAAGTPIGATSWIDAPLDGSVVPVANTWIVAHSTDQSLVEAVVLEVDGTVLAERPVDPPQQMVTSRIGWLPPGPGTFTLVVRARNVAGEWGASAAATIIVATDAPAIPTAAPGESLPPGESASPGPTGLSSGPPASAGGSGVPGTTTTPGASKTPGPSKTPTPRTPPPTAAPTLCPLPAPTLLAPDDNVILAAADDPQPVFEWDWNGSPACIDHFVLVLNLDQQVEEYADSGGYQREYPVAPDTTVYQSPIVLLPDDSDLATGCGYYSWTVMAVDPDGNGEQAPQVWSIRVCPGRTG